MHIAVKEQQVPKTIYGSSSWGCLGRRLRSFIRRSRESSGKFRTGNKKWKKLLIWVILFNVINSSTFAIIHYQTSLIISIRSQTSLTTGYHPHLSSVLRTTLNPHLKEPDNLGSPSILTQAQSKVQFARAPSASQETLLPAQPVHTEWNKHSRPYNPTSYSTPAPPGTKVVQSPDPRFPRI